MRKITFTFLLVGLLAAGCNSSQRVINNANTLPGQPAKTAQHFRGIDKWGNPIPSSIGCKIRAYDPNDHSQFNTPYESEQVDANIGEAPLVRWVRDYSGSAEQIVWSSTDQRVAVTTSPSGYQNSLEFRAGGSAIVRANDTSFSGPCYVEFDISVK